MKIYQLLFENTDYNRLRQYLSEQRASRCEGINNENARLSSAYAYILLRYCLLKEYGITEKPVFDFSGYGKPEIKGSNLHIGISHAKNAVICAADSLPLGLDIQDIRKISKRAAEHFCTKEELLQAENSEDKQEFLSRIWCIKESKGKLSGLGFQEGFSGFSAQELIDSGTAKIIKKDDFYISVCSAKPDFEITEVSPGEALTALK
ncbi:MAG: 4'-phosphopantetheinyl transferase family protein [Ruminiclostridium sp.]